MSMDVENANDSQEDFLLKGGIVTVQNRRRSFPPFSTHTKVILCAIIPTVLFVFGMAAATLLTRSRPHTNPELTIPPLLLTPNSDVFTKWNATTIGNTTEILENEVSTSSLGFIERTNNERSQNDQISDSTKEYTLNKHSKYEVSSGFKDLATPSPGSTTDSNQQDQTTSSTIDPTTTTRNTESEKFPALDDSLELEYSTEDEDSSEEIDDSLEFPAHDYPTAVHEDALTTTPSPETTTESDPRDQTPSSRINTAPKTENIEFEKFPDLEDTTEIRDSSGKIGNSQEFEEFGHPTAVRGDALTTTPSPLTTTERTLESTKATTEKTERELFPTLNDSGPITTLSPGTTTEHPQSDHMVESATTKTTVFNVLPEFEKPTDPSTTPSPVTTTTGHPQLKSTKSAVHHKLRALPIQHEVAEYFHHSRAPKKGHTSTKHKYITTPTTAKPATNKNEISLFDIPDER